MSGAVRPLGTGRSRLAGISPDPVKAEWAESSAPECRWQPALAGPDSGIRHLLSICYSPDRSFAFSGADLRGHLRPGPVAPVLCDFNAGRFRMFHGRQTKKWIGKVQISGISLSVCPKSLLRAHSAQHQADHGQSDEGDRCSVIQFMIAHEAPTS